MHVHVGMRIWSVVTASAAVLLVRYKREYMPTPIPRQQTVSPHHQPLAYWTCEAAVEEIFELVSPSASKILLLSRCVHAGEWEIVLEMRQMPM